MHHLLVGILRVHIYIYVYMHALVAYGIGMYGVDWSGILCIL